MKVGELSIGYAVYDDLHHFGPELQFGHVVGEHFADPVLLIKTAWGGKSLANDFRPPSAEGETLHRPHAAQFSPLPTAPQNHKRPTRLRAGRCRSAS